MCSTDPVPHNIVISQGEEETLREQQEAAVDPQEQERTLQVPEESVESHVREKAVEPQVQGHESEGQYQYKVPNLNNPNAYVSHKQLDLVQTTVIHTSLTHYPTPPFLLLPYYTPLLLPTILPYSPFIYY